MVFEEGAVAEEVEEEEEERSLVGLKAKEEICFSVSSAEVNSSSPWLTLRVPLRKLSRRVFLPAHFRPP